jgi:hypothetical protein
MYTRTRWDAGHKVHRSLPIPHTDITNMTRNTGIAEVPRRMPSPTHKKPPSTKHTTRSAMCIGVGRVLECDATYCLPTHRHHQHDPKYGGSDRFSDPCSHRHTKKTPPQNTPHVGPCVPVRGVCSNATQPTATPRKSQPGTRRLVGEIRKNSGFHFRGFRENSADVLGVGLTDSHIHRAGVCVF